jgi:hypothetical protein
LEPHLLLTPIHFTMTGHIGNSDQKSGSFPTRCCLPCFFVSCRIRTSNAKIARKLPISKQFRLSSASFQWWLPSLLCGNDIISYPNVRNLHHLPLSDPLRYLSSTLRSCF